jgi:hypothetical protein
MRYVVHVTRREINSSAHKVKLYNVKGYDQRGDFGVNDRE